MEREGGRPTGAGRCLMAGIMVATLCLGLAGCGSADSSAEGAAAVTKRLGAFPIAKPPPHTIGVAGPDHFVLTSMGETVDVTLPGGGRVRLTGLGPRFPAPTAGAALPTSALGSADVAVLGVAGTVTLQARELVGTNEQGQAVALAITPSRVIIRPGQHALLHLTGTFTVGDGALSFIVAGHAMVTWDFNVELD